MTKNIDAAREMIEQDRQVPYRRTEEFLDIGIMDGNKISHDLLLLLYSCISAEAILANVSKAHQSFLSRANRRQLYALSEVLEMRVLIVMENI